MRVAEEAGGCIVLAGTTVYWMTRPHGFSDFGGRPGVLFSATSALNDELRAAPDNSDELAAGIEDNFASLPPHGRAALGLLSVPSQGENALIESFRVDWKS